MKCWLDRRKSEKYFKRTVSGDVVVTFLHCRHVMNDVSEHSLVLVDELGKGTEPMAGRQPPHSSSFFESHSCIPPADKHSLSYPTTMSRSELMIMSCEHRGKLERL